MTNQDKSNLPLIVSPSQAKYLREGFQSTKIGSVQNAPELRGCIQAILEGDESDTIPDDLLESARQLARLVIGTEIASIQTLIDTGRTEQLDARLGSDHGFISKYEALKGIISIDVVENSPMS